MSALNESNQEQVGEVKMEITATYVMPIAKFDASEFVEYATDLFAKDMLLKPSVNVGHKTTLSDYAGGVSAAVIPKLPNSEPLEKFIARCTTDFATALGHKTQLYEAVVKNIWLNEMVSGGAHPNHSHYGTNFSGCFYVQVPENSGFITIETPRARYDMAQLVVNEFTVFNSGEWTAAVSVGDLLLWEAHVKHQVKPTVYEGKRRSIAFDVDMRLKEGAKS